MDSVIAVGHFIIFINTLCVCVTFNKYSEVYSYVNFFN